MITVVSGHFDPCHKGHLEHFREAYKLGGSLIVVLNSDEQIKKKYGYVLQPAYKRAERIMRKAPFVQGVVISIDKDSTQAETLRLIRPNVFAKGGDRIESNMPQEEIDACNEIGCKIIYGIGGKIGSSSGMRERIKRFRG